MRTPPPPQHPTAFQTSFLRFLEEVGPVLILCVGTSLSITFAYYWLIDPHRQRQRKNHWLAANRTAMRKHLILQYALRAIYKKTPPCYNCEQPALEFWNHGRDLLVFRCRHCRYNHTLSAFHFPEVPVVLENLPGLFVALNQLKRERNDLLGRHLLEQCQLMDWYCRKYLQGSPPI